MKRETAMLLCCAVALAAVGMFLQRRAAAVANQQAVASDPMSWITEWGKNA